jgi:NADH-quinone oxidoreductase subunit L
VHPHESPRVMTIPLVLLAAGAIGLGVAIGLPPEEGWIHDFLQPNFTEEAASEQEGAAASIVYAAQVEEEHGGEHEVSTATSVTIGVISTVVALAGLAVAYMAYIARSPVWDPAMWAARLGGVYRFIFRKWMFDELYETVIVHPLYVFSVYLWQWFDVRVIDGTVNGVATGVSYTSSRLRRVQTGFVANYALAIALGAVIIVGAYFVFESSLFT